MEAYVGLDVSDKSTHVCVVDGGITVTVHLIDILLPSRYVAAWPVSPVQSSPASHTM